MKALKHDLSLWKKLPRTRKLLVFLAIAILFFAGFLVGMYVFSQ
jgi:hypothetical protein